MADPDSSSSEPRHDDFNSGGTKKRKLEKGKVILQVDSSSKQPSSIELPAIAVNIVPLLALGDALALGSCSKYLNGVCECESIWKEWYKRRWGPLADSQTEGESSKNSPHNSKGWKALYINQHKKMWAEIFKTFEPVMNRRNEELYSGEFFRELDRLKALNVKFVDIYFFLFRKDLDVVFNVIGLYYSFFFLRVSVEDIKKAVVRCQLADRLACISWCIPKNWNYGFYLPEENYKRVCSLGEIVENEMNVLYIFKETTNRANYRELSSVRVSGKIPEPEPTCDCEACRPNFEAGSSSS